MQGKVKSGNYIKAVVIRTGEQSTSINITIEKISNICLDVDTNARHSTQAS